VTAVHFSQEKSHELKFNIREACGKTQQKIKNAQASSIASSLGFE